MTWPGKILEDLTEMRWDEMKRKRKRANKLPHFTKLFFLLYSFRSFIVLPVNDNLKKFSLLFIAISIIIYFFSSSVLHSFVFQVCFVFIIVSYHSIADLLSYRFVGRVIYLLSFGALCWLFDPKPERNREKKKNREKKRNPNTFWYIEGEKESAEAAFGTAPL